MDPERWDRIKAIFHDALDLPKDERQAFVEHACAEEPDIQAEVEKLLNQIGDTNTVDLIGSIRRPYSLETGDQLAAGRFRILRFVGKGGMGEVYEAEDRELGGTVAIKILKPELLENPGFLTRFRREVQLARQVTHPSICRVFDVGSDKLHGNQIVFLTMEFLDGETLSQRLRRLGAGMDEATALPLARNILEGLNALHERGIIHRDFKPGNVMVVRSNSGSNNGSGERAVINDFGLAREIEAEAGSTLTGTNQLMGTPDYMAPEQFLGQPASRESDIYAIGLVLYELVTGKRPFAQSQRMTADPSPPQGVSRSWSATIMRCLARNPADRPKSAVEVLTGLLDGPVREPIVIGSPKRFASKAVYAGIATAGLLGIFLARSPLASRLAEWTGTNSTVANPTTQHLVLLPLKTIGEDPALRVFAEGLMDSIVSRMSQFEQGQAPLFVVPASEVRAQGAKTAGEAKRKFQANSAVEGSIEGEGDRLRLLLTLIDTTSMRQVETISIEGQRGNSFRLQDAAVTKLANALSLRLQARYAADQQKMSPVEPGAYEFYLQARGYLQRSDRKQDLESAVTLLKKTIGLDPAFAPAHSALAEAYLYQFDNTRDAALVKLALLSGNRALELNPNIPEVQLALGEILQSTDQFMEAKVRFEQAIALDPKNGRAYRGLAMVYKGLRDFDRAEATYLKAISMQPQDFNGYRALATFYYSREAYGKAAEQFQKVVELTPDNAEGFLNLGAAYNGAQKYDAAEKAWLRVLELDPKEDSAMSNLANLYLSEKRDVERAIEMYRRALALNPRSYQRWGGLGRALRRKGATAEADAAFTKALDRIDVELSIRPKSAQLYAALGFYRALKGRKDFESPLERALQLAPDSANQLLRAAESYAIAGQKSRAMELLRVSLAKGLPKHSAENSDFLKEIWPVLQAGHLER